MSITLQILLKLELELKLEFDYRLTSVTRAIASHCLVVALLSACHINQQCTASLFWVIPTIPPFILFRIFKKTTEFVILP